MMFMKPCRRRQNLIVKRANENNARTCKRHPETHYSLHQPGALFFFLSLSIRLYIILQILSVEWMVWVWMVLRLYYGYSGKALPEIRKYELRFMFPFKQNGSFRRSYSRNLHLRMGH